MKTFILKSPYLLILFILFLIRPYFYGVLLPKKDINYHNYQFNEKKDDTKDVVYGRILYQNPYKYQQELVIAINDNLIKVNDYVVNDRGLVGIIEKRYRNMAIVKMLTNKDILLQVQVNNCYGLLKYEEKIMITNVDAHCQINNNDLVYTSNLGYVQKQIAIGAINKIILDNNEIANSYEINYFNNEVLPNEIQVLRGQ